MLTYQGQSNGPSSSSQATLQHSSLQHRLALLLPPTPTAFTLLDAAGLATGEVGAGWVGARSWLGISD